MINHTMRLTDRRGFLCVPVLIVDPMGQARLIAHETRNTAIHSFGSDARSLQMVFVYRTGGQESTFGRARTSQLKHE